MVPAELPRDQRAGALPPLLRRRLHRRVPDRVRPAAAAGRAIADDLCEPAGVDLPGRPGRAAAVLRRGRPAADTTRRGRTTSCSASTSTATTAPASARRTRPAGPGMVADIIRRRHGAVPSIGDVLRAAVRSGRSHERRRCHRAALPGQLVPAGRHCPGRRHELRRRVRDGRRRAAVPVRRRRRRDPDPAAGARRRGLARRSCPASAPGRRTATGRPGPTIRRRGLRCNPAKLLLDPYARAIDGEVRFGPEVLGYDARRPRRARARWTRPAHVPRSLVVDPAFDWATEPRPAPPRTPTRSSTRSTSRASPRRTRTSRAELRGTYAGLGHEAAIAHLVDLGVTAVELLPVHHSVPEAFLAERGLTNYWGYNTIGYFAPHAGYSAAVRAGQPGRAGRRVQGDGRRPARRRASR